MSFQPDLEVQCCCLLASDQELGKHQWPAISSMLHLRKKFITFLVIWQNREINYLMFTHMLIDHYCQLVWPVWENILLGWPVLYLEHGSLNTLSHWHQCCLKVILAAHGFSAFICLWWAATMHTLLDFFNFIYVFLFLQHNLKLWVSHLVFLHFSSYRRWCQS